MKLGKITNIYKSFIFTLMFLLFTSIIAGQNNGNNNKSNNKGAEEMENTKTGVNTTEKMIIDRGYLQLSAEELKQRISDKTVKGDYYNGRKYVTYTDKNGNMEGKNDLGSHLFGKCTFNTKNNTFSVKWNGYWDTWTGRAYDVDGEIQFFDSTTSRWRTTFKKIEEGKKLLEV